ncbi:hypothetical protein B0H15DRAFT_947631 [Mycena belliarum]|uniref:Uncharacterized protein n=1 Tax=Mycena belliarum TaxID=1033014 RepID=A0AAD6UBX0_9AGAR|nr:hypothetical protein B0H15DRAFT_947631 [Mycena belliae]
MSQPSVPAPPGLSAHAQRNPSQPVKLSRSRPQAKLSAAAKATKNLNLALRQERLIAFELDLDAHHEFREAEITRIAEKHHMKEETVRQKLCNTTQVKTTRAPNLRNAIIHDMALKARAGEYGDLKVLNDLQTDLKDAIDAGEVTMDPELLSDTEKDRLIKQLVRSRHTQKRGARATNKAAAMDGRAVADKVSSMFLDLFERTGIRALALFTRGSPDDAAKPWGCGSDGAVDFFQEELGISYVNVIRKFEGFSCRKDGDVRESQDAAGTRRESGELILKGLRRAVNDNAIKMSYEHYDYDIRALRRFELVGWPEDIAFTRPGHLSAEDAQRIRNGLKDGSIFWHRMSDRDHKILLEEQQEQREATGRGVKQRAARSDKGKMRGPQKKKRVNGKGKASGKGKAPPDAESSDDESGDEDEEDEHERHVPHPARRVPAASAIAVAVASDPARHVPATSAIATAVASDLGRCVPATSAVVVAAATVDEGLVPHPPAASAMAATITSISLPSAPPSPAPPTLHLPAALGPVGPDVDWMTFDYSSMGTLDLDSYNFSREESDLLASLNAVEGTFPPTNNYGTDTALPPNASFINYAAGTYDDTGTSTIPSPALGITADSTMDTVPPSSTTSTAMLANTTNDSTSKKRKRSGGEEDVGGAPKKSRKQRSDKGVPRDKSGVSNGENASSEPRKRKVRCDKGVKRG